MVWSQGASSVQAGVDHFRGEDLTVGGVEFAHVFLAVHGLVEGETLFGEEVAGDAGALVGGDAEAGPEGSAVGPSVPEETALAAGCAEQEDDAVGDGEGRV